MFVLNPAAPLSLTHFTLNGLLHYDLYSGIVTSIWIST